MINNPNKSREPIKSDSPKEIKILSFLTFTGFKDHEVNKDTDWYDIRENMK